MYNNLVVNMETMDHKTRAKQIMCRVMDKLVYLIITLIALYIIFAGNLPNEIDKALIAAIFSNDFTRLARLAANNMTKRDAVVDSVVTVNKE